MILSQEEDNARTEDVPVSDKVDNTRTEDDHVSEKVDNIMEKSNDPENTDD